MLSNWRQVQHKQKKTYIPDTTFTRGPGLALTVYHDTRNKILIHAQNYYISYNHTLLLEKAIANAVVKNTKMNDGLYVLAFLK